MNMTLPIVLHLTILNNFIFHLKALMKYTYSRISLKALIDIHIVDKAIGMLSVMHQFIGCNSIIRDRWSLLNLKFRGLDPLGKHAVHRCQNRQ